MEIIDLIFKTRYNNISNNQNKKNSTTLSTYIWENNLNPNPIIKWDIMKKCHKYRPRQKISEICLSEKLEIVKKNLNNSNNMNKITDIGNNKCTLHKNKHTFR